MIERFVLKDGAPSPRGPYSHAVRAGDFLYVSGMGPADPATDRLSAGDIRHETRVVLGNLKIILERCGASLADVVKCTVYLLDAKDFAGMNEVYAEFFGEQQPARTTVEARLVAPMRVEIDCIAYQPKA